MSLDDGHREAAQLEIEYQPVINLQSGNISGLEALIRWNHPTRGRVNPGRFIALAEEDGSIVDLGRWVVDDACRQFAQWKRIGVVGPMIYHFDEPKVIQTAGGRLGPYWLAMLSGNNEPDEGQFQQRH